MHVCFRQTGVGTNPRIEQDHGLDAVVTVTVDQARGGSIAKPPKDDVIEGSLSNETIYCRPRVGLRSKPMASLRDVADRAGVSLATASRVASGSSAVRG